MVKRKKYRLNKKKFKAFLLRLAEDVAGSLGVALMFGIAFYSFLAPALH